MLPACQILAAPRSNPKSPLTVHTALVSLRYMSHNSVRNVVPRCISQDAGWNSPPICHLQSSQRTCLCLPRHLLQLREDRHDNTVKQKTCWGNPGTGTGLGTGGNWGHTGRFLESSVLMATAGIPVGIPAVGCVIVSLSAFARSQTAAHGVISTCAAFVFHAS
jgi:hypothetical protein